MLHNGFDVAIRFANLTTTDKSTYLGRNSSDVFFEYDELCNFYGKNATYIAKNSN